MPIEIVRNENTADELLERLYDLRAATPEARLKAAAALKTANRHVDLGRLSPGTVLNVPENITLARRDPDAGGRPTAGSGVAEDFVRELRALRERVEQGLTLDEAEDGYMAAMLQTQRNSTSASAQAKALMDRVGDALSMRARERAQQQKAFGELVGTVERDFQGLLRRWSG
jgi:hypothetical protein